jgi:hypothetical protein
MLPKPNSSFYHQWCHARSSRRERVLFWIGIVLLLLVAIAIKYDVSIVIRSSFSLFSSAVSEKTNKYYYSKTRNNEGGVENNCQSIMLHEEGHWEHQYSQSLQLLSADDATTINKTYFPTEIDWMLRGTKNSTSEGWIGCQAANDDGLTYVSQIGHQCGCGLPDFQPSLSRWISAAGGNTNTNGTTTTAPSSETIDTNRLLIHQYDEQIIDSPTLRLILKLAKANMSLCLAGDSIDLQFYYALRNNLSRQRKLLRNQINISISDMHSIPVNYTNETGFPTYTGWMTMSQIVETVVSIKNQLENDNDDEGEAYTTSFRYFQMYGWSPWVTSFMDDCDVVVMNLGLHYSSRGDMRGTHFGSPKYRDDVMAAMTYMADFASDTTMSGRDRIMVWRSVLPQHFNSTDGHYEEGLGCSLKQLRPKSGMIGQQEIQNYNNVTNSIFLESCHLTTQEKERTPSCAKQHHEYDCTVNRTSVEYSTVYKFLLEHNCTARLARFQDRVESIVTGRILRWNIADLFDVPDWHSTNGDCSHFCYVMPLYEAAFERLDLLLSTLV